MRMNNETAERIAAALEGIEVALVAQVVVRTELYESVMRDAQKLINGRRADRRAWGVR